MNREPFWWPMKEPPLPEDWSMDALNHAEGTRLETRNGWLFFLRPVTPEDLEMK